VSPGGGTGEPDNCLNTAEEPQFDKNLQTSLTGLPEKIVAGSGFHNFKLNVANKGKTAYKRVDLGVFAAQVDGDTLETKPGLLVLQYQDPASGKWVNISLKEDTADAGYLGYTDVKAKESFSVDLRVSVDKSAPAGFGYAVSAGAYADDKGNCVFSDDGSFYQFDILAAGKDPGKPNDAKPQEGGQTPIPAKPVGDTEIQPVGYLAETGSSSATPVIGLVGGITVLLGAGVVFALKRRRNNTAA
jgi:LPXTG-motif cell wall-anchored protein